MSLLQSIAQKLNSCHLNVDPFTGFYRAVNSDFEIRTCYICVIMHLVGSFFSLKFPSAICVIIAFSGGFSLDIIYARKKSRMSFFFSRRRLCHHIGLPSTMPQFASTRREAPNDYYISAKINGYANTSIPCAKL